jgi:MFS family permease
MNSLAHFLLCQSAAVEPWFDPHGFGVWYGSIGGATVGLLGGFFGAVGSWAAQRGKWRGAMLGGMAAVGGLCALSLLAGVAALILGQPHGVWYPLTLIGAIGGGCFLGLLPVMRKRYAEAEARRLDADALRRS